MGYYLEDHPPARRQYINPRRRAATGAIVVHTAENSTDLVLPDAGAEGVARYISTRSNAGSYHDIVDSDSIVHVGRYEWEMFHEGTGGNRWSLGLSFACQASQWPTLPESWVTPALHNGAVAAAGMAVWVKATVGVVVPAKRITPVEYRAGAPGFIGHGELDPGRRTDPGAQFPWGEFLEEFRRLTEPKDTLVTHPDAASTGHLIPTCLAELDAISLAVRGRRLTDAEYESWSRDLVAKVYEQGHTDLGGVTRWAHWALTEGK